VRSRLPTVSATSPGRLSAGMWSSTTNGAVLRGAVLHRPVPHSAVPCRVVVGRRVGGRGLGGCGLGGCGLGGCGLGGCGLGGCGLGGCGLGGCRLGTGTGTGTGTGATGRGAIGSAVLGRRTGAVVVGRPVREQMADDLLAGQVMQAAIQQPGHHINPDLVDRRPVPGTPRGVREQVDALHRGLSLRRGQPAGRQHRSPGVVQPRAHAAVPQGFAVAPLVIRRGDAGDHPAQPHRQLPRGQATSDGHPPGAHDDLRGRKPGAVSGEYPHLGPVDLPRAGTPRAPRAARTRPARRNRFSASAARRDHANAARTSSAECRYGCSSRSTAVSSTVGLARPTSASTPNIRAASCADCRDCAASSSGRKLFSTLVGSTAASAAPSAGPDGRSASASTTSATATAMARTYVRPPTFLGRSGDPPDP
jgi:hypothetical protein